MKRISLSFLLAFALMQPALAETAKDHAWEKIVETDEGLFYLDRESITDATFNGAAVLMADVKISNFKGYPGATELHGSYYFRCDPAEYLAIREHALTADGKTISFPPPAVWHFSSEPEGSPFRAVMEKACQPK